MTKKFSSTAVWTALIAIGCLLGGIVFRLWKIWEPNFIFFDEAYYLNVNRKLLILIDRFPPDNWGDWQKAIHAYLRMSLATGKALWFMLADLRAFWGGFENYAYPRILASIFGILTIPTVFFTARRMTKSLPVAVLSSVLLALSPSHIFYSRLGMQETLSTLSFLLGVLFYLKSADQRRWILVSGLCFVAAYFSNYRLIILPVFIALIEFCRVFPNFKRIDWRRLVWVYVVFASGVVLVGNLYQGVNTEITFSWMFHQADKAKETWDWINAFSYPYYLMRFEGVIVICLFFANVYYVFRKDYQKLLPLVLVVSMMAIFTLTSTKGARYLCVGLPFLMIAVAQVLRDLWTVSSTKIFKGAVILGVFLILGFQLRMAAAYTGFESGYSQAATDLQNRAQTPRILSTQEPVFQLYLKTPEDVSQPPKSIRRLIEYERFGYQYLVLDPQAYVSFTEDDKKFSETLRDYLGFIHDKIRPVAVFPHLTPPLLERFVFEHNENLLRSIRFLKGNPLKHGSIKIYDLSQCIAIIQKLLQSR